MGKYFRTIYLYIVAFATLCMVIVGFVGTVNGLVSYSYPVIDEYEITDMYYKYDEEYKTNKNTAIIEEMIKVKQRENIKYMFTYVAVLACGLPLHVFHIKQIKKESEKEV